ncbi:unnamed protein product [Cylicocyclus nassatus]|uniref:T-cell immunomodulatory protein TIP C2 domain-containing protein n=1 Tax=Cylicocyclus nassatus TaxID=53992 RepID=A0AA36MDP6_CYLNA|nr:unnamed protein product [Cylicocyclus nassatus]
MNFVIVVIWLSTTSPPLYKCDKNGTRRFEINKSVFIRPKEVALGEMKMASFFDLKGPVLVGAVHALASVCPTAGVALKGASCQLPASTHRALAAPYLLFGLGRSPNFVDELTIGAPRYCDGLAVRKHTLKQFAPNSRIVFIPFVIYSLMLFRVGEFSLDGYPDLLAVPVGKPWG